MHTKKKAVVIGATGNLGSAIVVALEKAGYEIDHVWTRVDHPDAMRAESYANLPPRIDLAVYAAGINLVKPVHEITNEEWDKVMSVNVRGAFLFARAAFEGLKNARGVFVTISSMNAGFPYPGRAPYTTSKAALEGLTRALAVEWGEHGISTLSLRLGPLTKLMKTTQGVNPLMLEATKKRLPHHELIPPEAVADFIATLGAGSAKWVTGSTIDFEAGFTLNAYPLL
jgi:NAD(P)-dependent dehydrogenase (short-subunit alcohol dehydrogenase family)